MWCPRGHYRKCTHHWVTEPGLSPPSAQCPWYELSLSILKLSLVDSLIFSRSLSFCSTGIDHVWIGACLLLRGNKVENQNMRFYTLCNNHYISHILLWAYSALCFSVRLTANCKGNLSLSIDRCSHPPTPHRAFKAFARLSPISEVYLPFSFAGLWCYPHCEVLRRFSFGYSNWSRQRWPVPFRRAVAAWQFHSCLYRT